MTYQFDVDIATQYGVNGAILIQNVSFWIIKNKANHKNFFEGRYWTYNSISAFEKLFPFWNERQIRYVISKLIEENVLMKGYFNESSYDRTAWYSFTDDFFLKHFSDTKNDDSSCQKSNSHLTKLSNEKDKNVKCNIGTDINTDNKTQIESSALAFFESNYPEAYDTLMMQFKKQINDFFMFSAKFDATFEMEKLEYDRAVLSGRFKKFALTWISNQKKYDNPAEDNNQNKPKEKISCI